MIYFGQFTSTNGDIYSVTMGDWPDVIKTKIQDTIKTKVTKTDYPLPAIEGAVKAFGFNKEHSLQDNQIIIPAPTQSMLEDNECAMVESKTPPQIRIDVTGYKFNVDDYGNSSFEENTITTDALELSYMYYPYTQDLTGADIILYGCQVAINAVNFPDSEDYYYVKVEMDYEGYDLFDEPIGPAWNKTYYIVNDEFKLKDTYEITGTAGESYTCPSSWTNITSKNPRICVVSDGRLIFKRNGTTAITFNGGVAKIVVTEPSFNYVTFGGTPIKIKTKSEDGLVSSIKGSSATISIVSETPLWDLYSSSIVDNPKVCKINKNNDIIFYGYITPNDYDQPFVGTDEIELECVDLFTSTNQQYVSELHAESEYQNIMDVLDYSLSLDSAHPIDYILPKYYEDHNIEIHNSVALIEDFTYRDVIENICTSFGLTATYYNDTVYFLDYAVLQTTPDLIYTKRHYNENNAKYESSTMTLNAFFEISNNGQKDSTMSLNDTYKNITIKQVFSSDKAINIVASSDENVTFNIVAEDKPYSYIEVRDNDKKCYYEWMEFFKSAKYPYKVNKLRIKFDTTNSKWDWTNLGMLPESEMNKVNQNTSDRASNTSFKHQGFWWCLDPWVWTTDNVYNKKVPFRNTLVSISPQTTALSDDKLVFSYGNNYGKYPIKNGFRGATVDFYYKPNVSGDTWKGYKSGSMFYLPTWDVSTLGEDYYISDNGLLGDGYIYETCCPVRFQNEDSENYNFRNPKSEGWTEAFMFSSFGIDAMKTWSRTNMDCEFRGYSVNNTSMMNNGHGLPYRAGMKVDAGQTNISISKYMIVSGSAMGATYLPDAQYKKHIMRKDNDNIEKMNGIDCHFLWASSDGHYFSARQDLVNDNDQTPKVLIKTSWVEISHDDYVSLKDQDVVQISTQIANLAKIPINLADTDTRQTHSQWYEFSNDAKVRVNESISGYSIPLPWYTDSDAPSFEHPWSGHDGEDLYSGKSNVIYWMEGSTPSTISKTGTFTVVLMGSAFGGMNKATTSREDSALTDTYENYRYIYTFIKNFKLTASQETEYYDVNDDEGKAREIAKYFTYDYTKKDYKKLGEVELNYHSQNNKVDGGANNNIIIDQADMTYAPLYINKALGCGDKSSLEKALLQRYYTYMSTPKIKYDQTHFVDGFVPYTHATYDGLLVNSQGQNKILWLDTQERDLKYDTTRCSWIEFNSEPVEEVVPVNRKRKK